MAALEDQMQSMLPSADDDIRPEDYPQYKPDDFTGRSFAADSFQETKDRFMDAGKIDVDPDDPAILTAYKRAVDYLKDTGLAGLGLADTAFKYAVGSVAQVMPTEQLEKRMARDLYSMPEAFGGAVGAKSITQLDDAADAFLAGSKQVAQKLKTEYDPTMVRSFVGATPPTYQEREAPLSLLSGESDSASDEVLDIYNMGLLMFREPVVEFAETLDIPKKGLLGSEFLNRVKKNPSIPETSLQESVIEPSRRYTKDELLRALGVNANTKGTFRSVANISPARIKQFEQYQRQGRDAGFVGGTEIDYFDIPVDVIIGYPGKKFKAHSQHYQDETLVHVRGSILNTNPLPDRDLIAFDTIIDDDNFLLVEEIQSDLLTKGYVKPKSPFDAAFSEAIGEYDFENPVKYQEAYGDISTDIQKIFKELDEESIYSPELPIQLESFHSNPFFSDETETVFTNKISDKGYTTFEELKDYIKSQNTNSDEIWGILSRLKRKVPGVSVVNDAPGGKTYTNISLDLDDPTFENFLDTFYESVKGSEIDHEILMHRYEDFIDDYNEVLLKKIKEKGLSKELDLNDLQRLREKYEESGAKGTLSVGLPPIRKNKQAVDEALKVLIAKAAQQGVDKIVIPPAERIALARGRELKKDKGDRFYRTYVTDLNKSLKELEDNYPVIVYRDIELPYRSKADLEDGDPFGMMNEPDFTEIDNDDVPLEDIQDLMDADAEDIANILNPDEPLPPSKRPRLVKTGNKGTILDISELIDKYKIEQPRQFAKGGVAMNEQMEMAFMNQGGLKDDGMDQDPVSGNEVPSGSMASEVRDNISAQLSEGEYVVPADVVRFFGVKFFEDLRMQAKIGLQTMEANGRIGGEPVDSSPEEEVLSDKDFAMLLQQELGGTLLAEGGMVSGESQSYSAEEPRQFNTGGYSTTGFDGDGTGLPRNNAPEEPYVPGLIPSFDPSNYGLGFSMTPGYTRPPAPPASPTIETDKSCEARGMILGPNGICIPKPEPKRGGDGSSGTTPPPPGEGGSINLGGDNWFKDDSELLFSDPSTYIKNQLANRGGRFDSGIARAGALALPGGLGLILAGGDTADDTIGIAKARAALMVAEASGAIGEKEAKELRELIAQDVQGNFFVDKDGKGPGIGTGVNWANSLAQNLGFENLEDLQSNKTLASKTWKAQTKTDTKAPVKAPAAVVDKGNDRGFKNDDPITPTRPDVGSDGMTDAERGSGAGSSNRPPSSSPPSIRPSTTDSSTSVGSDGMTDAERGSGAGSYSPPPASKKSTGGTQDQRDRESSEFGALNKGGLMKKKRKK